MSNVQLILGDCLEKMKDIPDGSVDMVDIDEATFLAAQKRAADRLKKTPVATAAHYDARSDRVIVELSSGLGLMFKPSDVQGLEHATAKDLKNIEITPFGLGLHFPSVDADLYIPGLLDGFLGPASRQSVQIGTHAEPTGVACVNTGRNFIGIELDEGYFKIAEKRIAEARANTNSGTDS